MTNAKKFYGWKLVFALSLIVSVNLGLTFVGASVINAPMIKDLHLSRGTLGLGSTVFIIANGLVAPIAAYLVNAWGARLTLCFGSLLVALGSLLLATWVSQGWHFVLTYGVILGLGNGFGALIPAQTCVTNWFEKRRVLALSLVLTGTGIGGLVYPPLITRWMAAADGNWRAGWYFVLGAGLAAAAIALLFVRNRPGDYGQVPDGGMAEANKGYLPDQAAVRSATKVYRTHERWTIREAVRTPALWLISAAAVGESATSTGGLAHAVPHLRDLGHSAEAAAAAIGAFSICSIAGKMLVGLLCDRIDPRNAWAACITMMGLAVWVATRAQSTEAMFLFTGLLGLGSGGALACWHATVANYFGPAAFPSILGAQMPFSNAMAAAGPYLVGVAYDMQGSYNSAFYALAAFSVITALMLLAATPPRLAAIATS